MFQDCQDRPRSRRYSLSSKAAEVLLLNVTSEVECVTEFYLQCDFILLQANRDATLFYSTQQNPQDFPQWQIKLDKHRDRKRIHTEYQSTLGSAVIVSGEHTGHVIV